MKINYNVWVVNKGNTIVLLNISTRKIGRDSELQGLVIAIIYSHFIE